MRTVFAGSGEFSRDLLRNLLLAGFELAGVITQPDRPAGRGLRLHATPVASLAEEKGLVVRRPPAPQDPGFRVTLRELQPDLLLVADYGHILPRAVLDIPPLGCVNVHPSLLPRHRGAAPIQRALMQGAPSTGVTLIVMDEGIDSGPVIAKEELEIADADDAGTLREKLALLGARMVEEFVPLYAAGRIAPEPQDERFATYAEPIRKGDLRIDWSRSARDIHNQVRALSPRPGAHTYLRGRRVKILRTRLRDDMVDIGVATLVSPTGQTLVAGAGKGALELQEIQPEGRRAMSAGEFMRGYRLRPGEGFGGGPA